MMTWIVVALSLLALLRVEAIDLRIRGLIGAAWSIAVLVIFDGAWTAADGAWAWETSWLPDVGVHIALFADGLSALFVYLVTGIGALIFLYTGFYLKGYARSGHMLSLLVLFQMAMLAVVLSDDVITLFVSWEMTSVVSYLLISSSFESANARMSGRHAMLITGLGGLCLLGGLIISANALDAWRVSELIPAAIEAGGLPTGAWALILVGALSKSALFPFHVWLPLAMAAPTPVSAYLHSATMVKAGVFLLLRMDGALSLNPLWTPTLLILGAITFTYAGYRSLRVHDLKQVLAWTTIAALGTITAAIGLNSPYGIKAAILFIVVHALYKSSLFMLAGTIDKAAHTRDLRKLAGLAKVLPIGAAVGVLAGLSMAGLPPMIGFIGKEVLYGAMLKADGVWLSVVAFSIVGNALALVAAVLVGVEPFRAGGRGPVAAKVDVKVRVLAVISLVPAAASLLFGLFSPWLERKVLGQAVSDVAMRPMDLHLGLWHGFELALVLSVITVALGIGLARWRLKAADRWIQLDRPVRDGWLWAFDETPYGAARMMRPLERMGVTGWIGGAVVTIGLLAAYVGVRVTELTWNTGEDDWMGAVLLTAAVAGVVVTCVTKQRITAIGGMGFSGAALAVWFLERGAPDVGSTQLLVEAISLLVLAWAWLRSKATPAQSSLPAGAEARRRNWRVAFALLAGVGVTLALLLGGAWAPPTDVSHAMIESSYAEAHGRNVVNVVLVDFRLMDTFGESAAIAFVGLAVLMLLLRRTDGGAPRGALVPAGRTASIIGWLLLLLSIPVFYRGHHEPGGGFIGGLVAGMGMIMIGIVGGSDADRKLSRAATILIGLGAVCAAGAVLPSVFTGQALWTGVWDEVPLPLLGDWKVGSIMLFDLGVYLGVMGFCAATYASLRRAEAGGSFDFRVDDSSPAPPAAPASSASHQGGAA